jgi:glucosamine--fructose-6-phosphate aminotransferase (isomerizing)
LYLGRDIISSSLRRRIKIKEISYIHAEGYPAAEMKHGPIALIDEKYAGCCNCKLGHYDKIVSNIQEIKSRSGRIIAVVTKGYT